MVIVMVIGLMWEILEIVVIIEVMEVMGSFGSRHRGWIRYGNPPPFLSCSRQMLVIKSVECGDFVVIVMQSRYSSDLNIVRVNPVELSYLLIMLDDIVVKVNLTNR